MAWDSVDGSLVAKMLLPKPRNQTKFLPDRDMDRLKESVEIGATSVLTRCAGVLLIEYHGERIFVHPERGYAPAGWLELKRLIEQEVA